MAHDQPSLLTLPPELLCNILDKCGPDKARFKTLRLTNKLLCEVSTAYLFEHVHMGLFEYSLCRLQRITDSRFVRFVKKFTFHVDLLPEWDREDMQVLMKLYLKYYVFNEERSGYYGSHDDLATERQDQEYSTYRRLRLEQLCWSNSELALRFNELFSRLPKLQEATLTHGKIPRGPKETESPLATWQKLMLIHTNMPEFHQTPIAKIDRTTFGNAALSFLSAIAFRASFSGVKHVQKLSIYGMYPAVLPPEILQEAVVKTQEAFVNLTDLVVHIDGRPEHARVKADVEYPGPSPNKWGVVLCAPSNLTHLTLECGGMETWIDRRRIHLCDFELGLPRATWKQLKSLSLSLHTSTDELVGFLERHASTLRHLRMRDMVLCGPIQALFQVLSTRLELTTIYLECLRNLCSWGREPTYGEETRGDLVLFPQGSNLDMEAYRQFRECVLRKVGQLPRETCFAEVHHWLVPAWWRQRIFTLRAP